VGGTITDLVATEPIIILGEVEINVVASGVDPIPEIGGAVAASSPAGVALGGEIATPEVRDPPNVQGASELLDLDFDVLHECHPRSLVLVEAGPLGVAPTSSSTWWETVGSQGDPVIILRH
jgi:hypothetical protein